MEAHNSTSQSAHPASSPRQLTLSAHPASSPRQLTLSAHSVSSLLNFSVPFFRQLTPSAHSASSLRQLTPSAHYVSSLHQLTPSAHSVSSLHQEEMNVYLKIVKTIPMKVKGTDTVGALKANINRKEGIFEMNQKFFFGGKLPSNSQTVAGCGIQNSATLHLFANDFAAMKIFIKMPSDNKILTLEAKGSETVRHIKLVIEEKEGILSNSFTLVYNGSLLDDERILTSIGVRKYSTLQLVFSKKVVTFLVKPQGSEAVKLSVKVMFTVGDVKAIVRGMIGEKFSSNMSLYYTGEKLDHSKTLAFYDIKEGSVLDLLSTSMQIFVKTWNGKTLAFNDVQEHHIVKDVIAKSLQKLGYSIPEKVHVSLVYAGKRLGHDMDLASYRIQHDSTLQLVLTSLI